MPQLNSNSASLPDGARHAHVDYVRPDYALQMRAMEMFWNLYNQAKAGQLDRADLVLSRSLHDQLIGPAPQESA